MADPSAAGTRHSPSGIPLQDGYQTTISPAGAADLEFREISVKPPGIDGGDAIDFADMQSSTWRIKLPRSLKEMTECTVSAHWDPLLYTNALARVNQHDTWTIFFPDGSTLAFYGFLRQFEPDELSEGEPPTCTLTIQPTSWDADNDVEADYEYTNVAGT